MSHTVLLVEDNEMNRDMLARRLVRRGYVVHCAEDGRQGVDMAGDLQPDVILMDLSLPILDGWEASTMLKGSSKTRRIPIIALTAHALSGEREKCIEAGMDEYLTKPVHPDVLSSALARQLTRATRFLFPLRKIKERIAFFNTEHND